MPRAVVLLPSTTYRAADFVAAAGSLGVDLVVVSDQPPPMEMGDNYLQVDCSDLELAAGAVISLGDDVPLDGVVAADDAGVVIAALAGTELGLLANPPEAARATRDKASMRGLLERAEVPQPDYALLTDDSRAMEMASEIGYPLIVKPVSRSASQGVIRVDSAADLGPTIERLHSILDDRYGKEPLLLERYVPGDEVAVEGLLHNGELNVLALLDKPEQGEGPFFPETIMVTPSRLPRDVQEECLRVAQAATHGLGLLHGPVHVELRATRDRVAVIEVAARSIGGLCSRSLNFGLMGTTLEQLILRNALGMDKPELHRESAASGVLMIPTPESGTLLEVDGLEEVRSIGGVTGIDITMKPGDEVLAPPEGDRYLGFVFARAEDPGDVVKALRKAENTIQVRVK